MWHFRTAKPAIKGPHFTIRLRIDTRLRRKLAFVRSLASLLRVEKAHWRQKPEWQMTFSLPPSIVPPLRSSVDLQMQRALANEREFTFKSEIDSATRCVLFTGKGVKEKSSVVLSCVNHIKMLFMPTASTFFLIAIICFITWVSSTLPDAKEEKFISVKNTFPRLSWRGKFSYISLLAESCEYAFWSGKAKGFYQWNYHLRQDNRQLSIR